MAEKNRKNDEHEAPLITVPGRLFFFETLACPESADAREAEELAESALEAASPFPPGRLAHGRRREAGRLLLFATLKERLAETLPAEAETARHVLPDAALPLPGEGDGLRWVLTGAGLTAVEYLRGAPSSVRGFPAPGTAPAGGHRARMAGEAGLAAEGPLWRLVRAVRSPKPAGLELYWERDDGEPGTAKTFLSEAEAGAADVRPAETVAALRRRERAERRLRPVMVGLKVAFAAAALAQAGVVALHLTAARREARLEAGRPFAEATEAKAATLDALAKVTDRRPPQLEWLAALNETRPDSVRLRRVTADTRSLSAAGTAASMEALNGWLAGLRRNRGFERIDTPRITNAGNRVTFELSASAAPAGRRREVAP